ncbi:TPA: hypothetical protein PRY54_003931 [Escherichia coli]|uniref:PapB/FocB family fimbrial expression transcriptional regulator n=1 Tax=Salmonella enterica TaxID=28901 RepID=UPI0009AE8F50|nr:PapB/FocB family fimbrial expression transcriptional regulator [Salmonella enterica]EBW7049983.1 hypothetical protein [Salmonella enterica subsp. enterica serovar Muenchen]ECI7782072.1 hypothetical protein [Salmonella enterica subsp. enterica]EDV7203841.1 hypothetical protein [Salmonella enterica subsp. enterica serovar Bredeney]MBS9213428.1 hypothetical protein [Escherichia coli]EBI8251242.1 hypothetical protein [Salmonella enterica]
MTRYESTNRLVPGSVNKELFFLLIKISNIRSGKVIYALEDYFVQGIARKVICSRHNVNPGYLSLKIRELQSVSATVYQILPFYIDRMVILSK